MIEELKRLAIARGIHVMFVQADHGDEPATLALYEAGSARRRAALRHRAFAWLTGPAHVAGRSCRRRETPALGAARTADWPRHGTLVQYQKVLATADHRRTRTSSTARLRCRWPCSMHACVTPDGGLHGRRGTGHQSAGAAQLPIPVRGHGAGPGGHRSSAATASSCGCSSSSPDLLAAR